MLTLSTSAVASAIVVSVDEAIPAVPVMFKQEIIDLPSNIKLDTVYQLVFRRENKENSMWLLMTPPPHQDPTAEFIAEQLKFAWSPLSDGLSLTLNIRCTPIQSMYERGASFLSSTSVAFARTVMSKTIKQQAVEINKSSFQYDTERFERLQQRNSLERNGKLDATAEVDVYINSEGFVEEATIASTSNPKFDVSLLRTIWCTRFQVSGVQIETTGHFKLQASIKK
jgi:hypothetical protein